MFQGSNFIVTSDRAIGAKMPLSRMRRVYRAKTILRGILSVCPKGYEYMQKNSRSSSSIWIFKRSSRGSKTFAGVMIMISDVFGVKYCKLICYRGRFQNINWESSLLYVDNLPSEIYEWYILNLHLFNLEL